MKLKSIRVFTAVLLVLFTMGLVFSQGNNGPLPIGEGDGGGGEGKTTCWGNRFCSDKEFMCQYEDCNNICHATYGKDCIGSPYYTTCSPRNCLGTRI